MHYKRITGGMEWVIRSFNALKTASTAHDPKGPLQKGKLNYNNFPDVDSFTDGVWTLQNHYLPPPMARTMS